MIRLTVLCAALLLLGGCANSSYRTRTDDARQSRYFALYRIEIDRAAVRSGARLLFTEPPAGVEYGHTRKAGGEFAVSDNGLVACRVRVIETSTGVDGRMNPIAYGILDFRGRTSDDGERATIHDGDVGVRPVNDIVDEIRMDTDGADKLVVQPYVQGRPQAYRFHFTRSRAAITANVEVPWR
ncbi:MAG: hypothetical protein R3F20_11490 [Planctomycetota bacterium]